MKATSSKLLAFVVACAVLAAALYFINTNIAASSNKPSGKPGAAATSGSPAGQTAAKGKPGQAGGQKPKRVLADINVLNVTPASYAASLNAYAQAEAHFQVSLTSQVNGQITAISDQFALGERVKKGTWLVSTNRQTLTANVASAKQAVSTAKVNLLEAQRESDLAKKAWKVSGLGNQPTSELVFKQPQVDAAQAAYDSAKASLTAAEYTLNQSQIRAPFNAIITDKSISVGQYLSTGASVGELISTDFVEIPMLLSYQQWALLPSAKEMIKDKWSVTVTDALSSQTWQGYVSHAAQTLDTETRQRTLIVRVDAPFDTDTALMPGSLVNVQIKGKQISNLWKLPNTAISQTGHIWYVGKGQKLASIPVTTRFIEGDQSYVVPPEPLANAAQLIIKRPLSSLVSGTAVNPVEVAYE